MFGRDGLQLMGRGKSQRSWELIEAARNILDEIQPTTIRSVCYQLFIRHLIRSMAKSETNRVSTQLTWAREQGEIPWRWIVDETREPERAGWENPEAFIDVMTRAYRRDRWSLQERRIEVWSEKSTVRGTLAPVINGYGVTFRVMHGYASATAVYQAVRDCLQGGRPVTAFYVGDWDPSGLHMSEVDLPERLSTYWAEQCGPGWWREDFDRPTIGLRRLALNEDDVADQALPWFDASTKRNDPRWRWYVEEYGQRCWELDALNPVILRARVEEAITEMIDPDPWNRCARAEAAERESLASVLGTWKSISRPATE